MISPWALGPTVEEILHHLGWFEPNNGMFTTYSIHLVQDFATSHRMVLWLVVSHLNFIFIYGIILPIFVFQDG